MDQFYISQVPKRLFEDRKERPRLFEKRRGRQILCIIASPLNVTDINGEQ